MPRRYLTSASRKAIDYFEELAAEYEQEGRGLLIRRINDSFQFVTRADNGEFVRRLCTPVKIKKLSQACSGGAGYHSVQTAGNKGRDRFDPRHQKRPRDRGAHEKKNWSPSWADQRQWDGPLLYGTTDGFLKNFGFESLQDLPEIDNIEGIIDMDDSEDDDDDSRQITIEMEGENVRNN
jgi:segregation and condensation protein B